jgi:hypothetical protein
MKKNKLVYLFAAGFAACTCALAVAAGGESTTATRSVSEFHTIQSSISADIYLSQGSSPQLKIEAEESVMKLITTEVSGGKLMIKSERNFSSNKPIKIWLTAKEIRAIGLMGSGNVKGETPISGESLEIQIMGSGDVEMSVSVKNLETSIAGSGNVRLSGKADRHELSVAGSGDVSAQDLQTVKTKAEISGSGDCKVDAKDELEVSVSGSGDVAYKTEPARLKTSVSGSGDVHRIK